MINKRLIYNPYTMMIWMMSIIGAFVFNMVFFENKYVSLTIIFSLGYIIYFYKILGVGVVVDEWYYVRKSYLFNIIVTVLFISLSMIFFIFEVIISSNYEICMQIFGAVSFIIGLIALFIRKDFTPKKKAKDYPNLKQERMYDDINMPLDETFKYRVKKKEIIETIHKKGFLGIGKKTIKRIKRNEKGEKVYTKVVDYSDVNLDTVDFYRNLLPDVETEIKDIINKENMDFYEYHLTEIEDEKGADKLIKKLSLPIKEADADGFIFPRFWYNELKKRLESINKDYDFKKSIRRFNGIFEYAMIDMFVYTREFKNVSMGNSRSYAVENKQSLNLYGALNSNTTRSVGRSGIAYYVGYHKTLELELIKMKKWLERLAEINKRIDDEDDNIKIYEYLSKCRDVIDKKSIADSDLIVGIEDILMKYPI